MLSLGRVKQFAVPQLRPAALVRGYNFVMSQRVAQWLRRALIEKNTHLCGGERASRGVIEDGTYLFKRHARKPIYELRDERAVLEILEKCGYGHASTAENPRSADPIRVSLDRGASRPINHGENGSTFTPRPLTRKLRGAPDHARRLKVMNRHVPSSAGRAPVERTAQSL